MSARSVIRRFVVEPVKRMAGRRWDPWRHRYWAVRQKMTDPIENRRWRVSSPKIVVVSEGAGTTGPPAYSHFLHWLARDRPEFRARVHRGCLPCRLPAGARLFHAWVQDPVIERAPLVYRHLTELEAECARRGVAVVHPANVLSNSKRDVIYERLRSVSLRTPVITLVDHAFPRHRGGLTLPMLVRHRWGHGGCMRRLDTETAFEEWWMDARTDPGAWVAGEYIDVRSRDGWYRKYRYFMAGSRGNARHLIVSPHWEVRPADRVRTDAAREEELAFVSAPFPHHARFDAARRALEFEIAAFDYSYDPDGGLVVWEVNPFPDLSRPKPPVGDYLKGTVERSYALLADFYAERAEIGSPP